MRIDMLEEQARGLLRLFGPRVSAAQDENIALRHCRKCTPPEPVWQCFICGTVFPDRWRFDLHTKIDPETCQRYARKWASTYAEMQT